MLLSLSEEEPENARKGLLNDLRPSRSKGYPNSLVPAVFEPRDIPVLRVGNPVEQKHLQATCLDCRGEFIFNPALGEVPLSGGKQFLNATFYPDDPSIYDETEISVSIDIVPKEKPQLVWEPRDVSYGDIICGANSLTATAGK